MLGELYLNFIIIRAMHGKSLKKVADHKAPIKLALILKEEVRVV